jgi:hypothetical protein
VDVNPTKSERALIAKLVGPLSLHKRVVALENEIQESRKLNQRLSDLIDVVTEVLVPAVDRDDQRMRAALARLEVAVSPPVTREQD